jgi:flagellar hook-associated protein 1
MSNLLAALSIATGALAAEQGALSQTANNVANINTPGYSREVPNFVENPPAVLGHLTFGTGVSLADVRSIRDPVLQLRIQQETGQQGQLNAAVSGLKQVQSQFSDQDNDIASKLSALFSSMAQLSTNPTSIATRQGILASASNLAAAFRNTSNRLSAQEKNIDLSVSQAVGQVNTLTAQIAGLNGEIASLENVGKDASAFTDRRDVLVTQLSGLMDVSQLKTESGITLTTSNGSALVVGDQSYAVTTQTNASGLQDVFLQGSNITGQLNSGELGGLLSVRDQEIPVLLTSLDAFAAALADTFNQANAAGFDLNGNAGTDLFTAPPASGRGAAASMSVTITDPSLIAASSDGSAGSNGNLVSFSSIHDQPLLGGATPSEYYATLIFNLGNSVSNGSAELESSQLVLQNLQDQRGSISGVSLDEEAANMVQYQRAYEAAARMVTTVDQMLQTIIHMGANG